MSVAQKIRPITVERHFTRTSAGSVLYKSGGTTVLCCASIDDDLPPWMQSENRGWITAEYNMLPGSTSPRKRRDRAGKIDGRTTEIQRLIGRSLRAIADMEALGPRQLIVDCDVLEADGGTRTASICGAFIAAVDAISTIKADLPFSDRYPLIDSLAAISVGIVDGVPTLDLDYQRDFSATVDMNVVMTGSGKFVELQGTGEESTFSESELAALLSLAKQGINEVIDVQKAALGNCWPF
jgi:ribonuclease PH